MTLRMRLAASGLLFLLIIHPADVQAERLSQSAMLVAAVSASATTTQKKSVVTAAPLKDISRDDLIALTQPSVVRILSHFQGTTTVPTFDVNLETLKWSVGSTAKKYPYDEYISGSGFIVSPNGYIVTNSHVISGTSLRTAIALGLATGIFLKKAAYMTRAQEARLTALGFTSEDYIKLAAQGVSYIADHLPAIGPPTIVVLKPSTLAGSTLQPSDSAAGTQKKQMQALMQKSARAKVVAVNDNYEKDEKDVAIIKVAETNLPFITLDGSGSLREGESIFVYGFPSSANINGFNTKASFTTGSVNAFQDSKQHAFKYIQTDAKVSPGSSGGPMFDDTSAVVGVVTLQSSNETGDPFAFAIPISEVKEILVKNAVLIQATDNYASHLRSGLLLQREKHCKAAIEEFNVAAAANPVFGSVAVLTQPYIDSCNKLIASGLSVDSTMDAVSDWIREQGSSFWLFSIIGLLLAVGLVVILVVLIRRMRRDEEVIEHMTAPHQTEPALAPTPAQPQVVVHESPQPASQLPLGKQAGIQVYIRQERQMHKTDAEIRSSLIAGGWDANTVDQNLKS